MNSSACRRDGPGLGVTGVLSLENLSDGGAFPEIYMRRGLFRGADLGLRGIDVGTTGYVGTENQVLIPEVAVYYRF